MIKIQIKRGIAFFLLTMLIFVMFTSCAESEPLPPFEERVDSYEVVSVYKYVYNVTNNMGGIKNAKISYSFSYLDGENLRHVDYFVHYDDGNTKVTLGDSDLYIVDSYTGEKYLQLTKETLKLLTGVSGQ